MSTTTNAVPTTTAGSGVFANVLLDASTVPPRERYTEGLFDVRVFGMNRIQLIPKTELAKSLLAAWLGQEVKLVWQGRNVGRENMKYGAGTEAMEVTFASRPMLAVGDDPHFTGIGLTPDEVVALRTKLDEMRTPKVAPKQRKRRRSR